ncbi:endonuclease domain-containing protein [Deinococcus cellulosilyticus]
MRERGIRPVRRGGNGQGLTDAQSALWVELWRVTQLEWIPEHPIRTLQPRGSGYPTNYKVDLAWPDLKIAVECDGPSHSSLTRKAQDQKKQKFLESLGWKVFRFSNQEILENTEACAQAVWSTTSK